MTKQSAKEWYQRIADLVDEYATRYYRGDQNAGFRHWAFNEVFTEQDLSDTEIMDKTRIDGQDDFEIDGYHVEESQEGKTIHLFQSKHWAPGTNVPDDKLKVFRSAPEALLNAKLVAECRNEETKVLHEQLVRLIPQEYSLRLVWVTSGTLSPRARKYAEEIAAGKQGVQIGSKYYEFDVVFEALDLRDLVALFEAHLQSGETVEPKAEFKVEEAHEVPGDYKTLCATIRAAEIIRIFDQNKFSIFRLNPRGPLGNKVNKEIRQSLQDPTLRRMFHLLNNGITAICDHYVKRGHTVEASNFLIVNGCQTTVTLHSERIRIKDEPGVLIDLKLVECPENIHRYIAKSTNTQTPLRAEDFVSTDPVQVDLQKQFDKLPRPWFYQIKRGEWARMVAKAEKERYREDGSFRWLKSIDVAQAVVAFLGFPGEAKDKIRAFFREGLSSDSEEEELQYKNVYGEGVKAIQLLLPALLLERIGRAVKENQEDVQLQAAGPMDWLEYARFHLLWLFGEMIRTKRQAGERRLLGTEVTASLIETIDQWFDTLYPISRETVRSAVEESKRSHAYKGHREFFRSTSNYQLIVGRLPTALEFARRLGSDALGLLP